MIFFTSDTHFNHVNICNKEMSSWETSHLGHRGFSSLEHMNGVIIDNINEMVEPDDTLYHLGDFAFGKKSEIPALRDRIKCKNLHLIFGNHDKVLRKKYSECFSSVQDYKEIRYNKTLLCLFHYAMIVWNEIGVGGIQLYGHSHNTLPQPPGRQMDVGVDTNSYRPYSIGEIMYRFQNVKPVLTDHHTENTSYG